MKRCTLFLGVALSAVAAGCNQAAPVTSAPAAAPETAATPAAAVPTDSAAATAAAPPADGVAAPPKAAPKLAEAETMKAAFRFRPSPDPDDPSHPRTNAHLVLQGGQPMDIDLRKFTGQPDVVNAAKARAANFPSGLLTGFRSYSAATGTSSDLAVLPVNGHRLRIVQRKVEETAAEPGAFETARKILLPANTRVVAAAQK